MKITSIKVILMFFILIKLSSQTNENWDSSGTGFIINPDGFILTAAHVVQDASLIRVIVNGRSWDASILSIDTYHDIALLSIQASGLSYLPLADSNKIALGEDIRVVGFPLSNVIGTSMKITKGSISGIMPIETKKYIQIDAAINPGNSGGPLINEKGQVVGIISSKINSTYADSIGFAVPINYANPLLRQEYIIPIIDDGNKVNIDGIKIANLSQQSVVYILVKKGIKENSEKEEKNTIKSENINTKNIYLYDKEDKLKGIISTDEENNPLISLYSKDDKSRLSLGFNTEQQPYVFIKNSNDTNASFSFSRAGNPGIWLFDKNDYNVARFVLTDNGSSIDLIDPINDAIQVQIFSNTKDGNQILLGGDSDSWRIWINDSKKGTFIRTFDYNGTYLWGSD